MQWLGSEMVWRAGALHTYCLYFRSAVSGQAFQREPAWDVVGCIGHVLVQLPFRLIFAKSFAALCSQPPSFLPSILDYPIMNCSLKCTLAVRPAMCSFISTDPGPLLCCDSKVCIVCGSAVEALPNHLWSSCIVSLTDLPVVWWTGGECLQGQGELSNAAGCMVSEWVMIFAC